MGRLTPALAYAALLLLLALSAAIGTAEVRAGAARLRLLGLTAGMFTGTGDR